MAPSIVDPGIHLERTRCRRGGERCDRTRAMIGGRSGRGPGKKSDRGAGASATHQTPVRGHAISPPTEAASRALDCRPAWAVRLFVCLVHRSIRSFASRLYLSGSLRWLRRIMITCVVPPSSGSISSFALHHSDIHFFGACPGSLIRSICSAARCSMYSLAAFVSYNGITVQLPSSSIPVLIALPCTYPRYPDVHLISLIWRVRVT